MLNIAVNDKITLHIVHNLVNLHFNFAISVILNCNSKKI